MELIHAILVKVCQGLTGIVEDGAPMGILNGSLSFDFGDLRPEGLHGSATPMHPQKCAATLLAAAPDFLSLRLHRK
jgi:hypothetical protein